MYHFGIVVREVEIICDGFGIVVALAGSIHIDGVELSDTSLTESCSTGLFQGYIPALLVVAAGNGIVICGAFNSAIHRKDAIRITQHGGRHVADDNALNRPLCTLFVAVDDQAVWKSVQEQVCSDIQGQRDGVALIIRHNHYRSGGKL